VIRRAIAALRPGLRDFDFKDVERAREFVILTTRSQQIDLSDNLRLEREGQLIWLADWATTLPSRTWPGIEPRSVFLLNPPDAIELPDGWQLRGEISIATPPLIEKACTNPDPWQAWLDLDRLQLPLVIRPRLPGDRIRPLGMQGHTHKLSDYMINVRIPRRARSRWPLVVSAQEIAWLPGHTISESFAVKPDTQRLLNLRLKHERRIVVDNPAPS
jgi:tRNA(Ile)-lysidine synthase